MRFLLAAQRLTDIQWQDRAFFFLLKAFVDVKDVFAILLTGFGKSFIRI